jgi:Flp pilus assembly protein TadG
VLLLFAVASVVLIGMGALVVDVGSWYRTAAADQNAADAAALASVKELVDTLRSTNDETAARAAAATLAQAVLTRNGVDPKTATVSFTYQNKVWTADVRITTAVKPIFGGIFRKGDTTIRRDAQAVAGGCQATCPKVYLRAPVGANVTAGTDGDGWQSVAAAGLFFNMYHHDDGAMYCVNPATSGACTSSYPQAPYTGMVTNYSSKLTPVGERVFFVVQQANTVGLGCWDATTHQRCTGYSSPFALASYAKNSAKNAAVRFDGPVAVGTRLFLLGDDLTIRCVDIAATNPAVCPGYPKNSPFSGQAGFSGTIASGVDTPYGVQFDMALAGNDRLFLLVTGVGDVSGGGSKVTRLACWNPATNAPCSGFGVPSTDGARNFLFTLRTSTGGVAGACARAGNNGGGDAGVGHECFGTDGQSIGAIPGMFTFTKATKAGQQEVETARYTVFPFRASSSASCWDWQATSNTRPWGSPCAGFASSWSGTEDYAYWTDGGQCAYGLGHQGKLWSFEIATGATPCGVVGTTAVLLPCTCADGTPVWSTLELLDAELSEFSSLVVTIRRPDGTVFFTGDLVTLGTDTIDLSGLGTATPYVTIEIEGWAKNGKPAELFVGQKPCFAMEAGVTPSLVG